MAQPNELEQLLNWHLQRRGLLRAPETTGFLHRGELVKVTIDQSVYTGWFVTVHDRGRKVQQFRARAGGYDWDAIAALVKDVAERRTAGSRVQSEPGLARRESNERLASDLAKLTGTDVPGALRIRPSPSPGHVRVELSEMELDPVSVLQLFAVVRHALPASRAKDSKQEAQLLV